MKYVLQQSDGSYINRHGKISHLPTWRSSINDLGLDLLKLPNIFDQEFKLYQVSKPRRNAAILLPSNPIMFDAGKTRAIRCLYRHLREPIRNIFEDSSKQAMRDLIKYYSQHPFNEVGVLLLYREKRFINCQKLDTVPFRLKHALKESGIDNTGCEPLDNTLILVRDKGVEDAGYLRLKFPRAEYVSFLE